MCFVSIPLFDLMMNKRFDLGALFFFHPRNRFAASSKFLSVFQHANKEPSIRFFEPPFD